MRPNEYLRSSVYHVNKHGKLTDYKVVTEGTYNVETGTTTNTETTFNLKIYKKHFKANQYNYPNLVGKDLAMFYIANHNIGFTPKIRDKIIYDSDEYLIDSIQEHSALGVVCLYRVIAVKG